MSVPLVLALACTESPCKTRVFNDALSQRQDVRVIAYETDCGLVSPANTKVAISRHPSERADGAALAFATEGYYSVEFVWLNDKDLRVLIDCIDVTCSDTRISKPLKQESAVLGVNLHYILSSRLKTAIARVSQ